MAIIPLTLRACFLLKLFLRLAALTLELALHSAAAALFIFSDTWNPAMREREKHMTIIPWNNTGSETVQALTTHFISCTKCILN